MEKAQDGNAEVDPEREARIKKRMARIFVIELKAALASFASILPPVFFTMLFSAVVVLYVTPDAGETFGESPIVLFSEDNADNNQEAATFGLVNALVIIGVITVMTFLIVCLLYFQCEKIFAGYLFFAMVMLMGFTTATMVLEGLEEFNVPTDIVTLGIFFYNYAIVGALAIFSYEAGIQGDERQIPYFLTQCYLVMISVVMAWLVTTIFPDFTVWALLVCLALYDLCAVLTPCGPLNLLLKVVTKRQDAEEQRRVDRGEEQNANQKQMIPGLLYEVRTGKSKGMKKYQDRHQQQQNDAKKSSTQEVDASNTPPKRSSANAGAAGPLNFSLLMASNTEKDLNEGEHEALEDNKDEEEVEAETKEDPEVEEDAEVKQTEEEKPLENAEAENAQPSAADQALLQQLQAENVELRKQINADELRKRRKLLEEKLYNELLEESNLKLGLGDFVFYSVLTAKAAEFGFIAFISVACCVLCGLCGTLVLLTVFQKALPALPISIALGVMTYVIVFNFVSPFADGLALKMATL